MVWGYARCSTSEDKQDISAQIRKLLKLGVQNESDIFWEYESGTKADRPELLKLLSMVKSQDTIVCTEVSRLTRSTIQLCNLLKTAEENHLKLVIGTFVIDCTGDSIDPISKAMLMMSGIFAELEREMIVSRVRYGMENARANGIKIGRKKTTADDIPSKFYKAYNRYTKGYITVSEMARILDCSRATVYKYIRIVESEELEPVKKKAEEK